MSGGGTGPERTASQDAIRALTWCALGAPALWWSMRYATDHLVYGEYIHHTGLFALQLVILALAVTPACRYLPPSRIRSVFLRSRRYIGVASFAYLVLHLGAYLQRQPWTRVLEEGADLAYLSGWVAAVIMLLLAATSNNRSVRRLGRRWKQLHRTVYLAAALIFGHWLLTAFDPRVAYPWIIALVLIEASRLVPGRQRP